MLDLTSAMRAIQAGEGGAIAIGDAERAFIEVVTFAGPEEILGALHRVLSEDWMGLPVWARNVAFRVACLQRPDDLALHREAAADLLCFGPDWDGRVNAEESEESDAVVCADCGRGCRVHGVKDADRVYLVGEVGDLAAGGPVQGAGFVAGGQGAADGLAAEDQ